MWKLLPTNPPGLCLQLLPLHYLLHRAVQQISLAFPHFSHTKSTRKIPLLRTKVVLLKLPSSDTSSNDVQIFISKCIINDVQIFFSNLSLFEYKNMTIPWFLNCEKPHTCLTQKCLNAFKLTTNWGATADLQYLKEKQR